MRRCLLLASCIALAVGIGTSACSQKHDQAARKRAVVAGPVPTAPPTTVPDPHISTVAQARGAVLEVFEHPGDSAPSHTFDNPNFAGAPAVFLVKQLQARWLEVYLPIRPNGVTGWVRQSDVTITQHNFRIEVSLDQHQITVYQGNDVIDQEAVGVGTGGTPTPQGFFYTMELLQPPTPGGPYGAFAYGLSAFSEVLQTFGGGPGQVAIHGTNAPGALGTNVSHGCIRMSNEGITKLSKVLPLGVPVTVQ